MRGWCVLSVIGWCSAVVYAGTPVDSHFEESVFAVDPLNLALPVRLAWAPDGSRRLFVARYHGRVQIVKDGVLLPTPFTKMDPIYANGECGLLGICFDPNFTVNRYVYFFVSVSPSEQQIIRYTDQNDTGADRTVIVSGLPTLGNQHNGGALAVGPDGKLYWGIGDLGERVGARDDLTTLASKIGRANLDGSVPNDNPFVDGDGPNNDYIWARGFRNPFEISFQPATGALWLNVVGNVYEQIFIVPRGAYGGWDEFERNHPDGVLKPVIKYRTNRTDRRNISEGGVVRENNVVTVTTADPHGFLKGESVAISDLNQLLSSSFYGTFTIVSAPTATSFTFAQEGSDERSGGGRAETLPQGGSVTGGAFYSSTAFPLEFEGNYFYGDYNSGDLMRAVIDDNHQIESVNYFVSGVDQLVDITVGPDGALYYIGHNKHGIVYRLAYAGGMPPELIVEPAIVNVVEGGAGLFTVRLSEPPASPISVEIARIAGPETIRITSHTTLLFTSANWSTPQSVTIQADNLPDGFDSSASFSVSGPGLATRLVEVTASDVPVAALVISTASVQLREGGSAGFTVHLSAPPPADITVQVTVTAGASSTAVNVGQVLTFNSANYAVPQPVILSGMEDPNLDNETATVTITAPEQSARFVAVQVLDNDPVAPIIMSLPPPAAVAGAPFAYRVLASGTPAPSFSLVRAPEGLAIDTVSGQVTWTPVEPGNYSISIRAFNRVFPDAEQTWVLTVQEDRPPSSVITKPIDGEIVSGSDAEWFGDGIDDVATVLAEFYVDDVLEYTEISRQGHYHYGGEHQHWDTSKLSNGVHRLKLVVRDTKGQTGASEISVLVSNPMAPTQHEADVNPRSPGSGDHAIELADWVQVGRFITGLDSVLSSDEFQRADCAPRLDGGTLALGDGVLSIADWVQAGRYAAGLDPVTEAGGPTFAVVPDRATDSAANAGRRLRTSDMTVSVGKESWLTVELDAAGDESGIGFSLYFDEEQVRYTGARLIVPHPDAALQMNATASDSGILGFAIVLPAGQAFPPGTQPVLELGFTADDPAEGLVNLEFADHPVRGEISDAWARPLNADFANGAITIAGRAVAISAAFTESGALVLQVNGLAGTSCQVQVSDDLTHWVPLDDIVISADGSVVLTDETAPQHGYRFYRVAIP